MSLTDITIRTAKPGDKAFKMYDERGLYLEVAPSGGKWWRLKYRHAGKMILPRFHGHPVKRIYSYIEVTNDRKERCEEIP